MVMAESVVNVMVTANHLASEMLLLLLPRMLLPPNTNLQVQPALLKSNR
jgi:hypothetical protein